MCDETNTRLGEGRSGLRPQVSPTCLHGTLGLWTLKMNLLPKCPSSPAGLLDCRPTGPLWIYLEKNLCISIPTSAFLAQAGIISACTTAIASSLGSALSLRILIPSPLGYKRAFQMQPDLVTSLYKTWYLDFQMLLGERQNPHTCPPLTPSRLPLLLCAPHTLLFFQSLLCFMFTQPQGLCTASLSASIWKGLFSSLCWVNC